MNTSVLKTNWERFKSHISLNVSTVQKLLQPVTQNKIAQLNLCSEGLANTSYQITFASHHSPVILRIYIREPTACRREFALYQLLSDKVPVAEILYVDTSCHLIPHPFAIMKWVDGILMRDVVLSGEAEASKTCTFAAGKYLAVLREIHFHKVVFFKKI